MICCFLCTTSNVLKPMDSLSSELSSMTDYLNNEKLCQDMCKTITQTVESTNANSKQIDVQPFPSLMPNINSDDDIEGILHEISEILAGQSVDNSQCTDNGLNDSRSVEEILKDAEDLVCSAAPYIEEDKSPVLNSNKNSCPNKSSNDNLPRKVSSSVVSFAKDSKQSSAATGKLHNKSTDVHIKRSKSFGDFEKTKILDDGIKLDRTVFSPSRPYIRNDNKKNKGIKKKSESYELKLSDLATVYEDVDVPSEASASNAVRASDATDNEVIVNQAINTIDNQDNIALLNKDVNSVEVTDNVALLKQEIQALNLKIAMYEKKDKDKTACEDRVSIAEHNRLALLKEEILSQEELIASYQRENQRLCSDIINAKVTKNKYLEITESMRQEYRNMQPVPGDLARTDQLIESHSKTR